ncbi:GTP-binding protein [Paenibacillaceae bacterium]|nr:GTP-binding protein [Paenibacillaceae bacterium]
MNISKAVPIHLITGFLGGGKTTLLARLLQDYRERGVKAAVIMNELGDVNLDGQLVNKEVPMSEMLGGCICCSIRSDVSGEISNLIDEHHPDVIIIESTGAANPLEIIEGVTEAALLTRIDLRSVVTVVDGPGLLVMNRRARNQTFRLMKEQIRCATALLINKADLLAPEEVVEVQQLVREWNSRAPLHISVKCDAELTSLFPDIQVREHNGADHSAAHTCPRTSGDGGDQAHNEPAHVSHAQDDQAHNKHVHASHTHTGHADVHHSHDHVMVLTHYLNKPVDSHVFEALLKGLPDDIYRAKGIVTFVETGSRFLFQFAYRETEFIRITPQGEVHDVAVFIGEHFDKQQLQQQLEKLL